jgi:hypothetical protein
VGVEVRKSSDREIAADVGQDLQASLGRARGRVANGELDHAIGDACRDDGPAPALGPAEQHRVTVAERRCAALVVPGLEGSTHPDPESNPGRLTIFSGRGSYWEHGPALIVDPARHPLFLRPPPRARGASESLGRRSCGRAFSF